MNPSTIFAENKHDCTITPSKRKKKINPQHKYFSLGKVAAQNPSIFYCIFNQGITKQYNALFSQESIALYKLSSIDPEKIDQDLTNFLSFLSLPCLCNSCRIKSLLFRNSNLPKLRNAYGQSYGCITACRQFSNNTTDS